LSQGPTVETKRAGIERPQRELDPQAAPAVRAPRTPPSVPTPRATRGLGPAIFPSILIACDIAALASAFVFTYWLRFQSGIFPSPLGIPSFSAYAWALAVVIPAGIFLIARAGLLRTHRRSTLIRDLTEGASAMALLALVLVTAAFFYREFSVSRTVLVGFWLFSTIFFAVFRRGASRVHRVLHERGYGLEQVALVGGGEIGRRLQARMREQPGFGMRVVAWIEGLDWRPEEADDPAGRKYRLERVRSLVRGGSIQRCIFTDSRLTPDERLDYVEECHGSGVQCDFVPDLFEVMLGRARVEEIDGVPLIGAKLHPLGRLARMQKRALDLVLSTLGLVVISPLLLICAAAIRMETPGSALFRQRRLGRDGREFDILKFRTMPVDVEGESGPVRARRGDGRATKIGFVLRRTSFDELPQLWNVVKGEMSLVGPRPERPYFVDHFQSRVPRYLERHGVKSGITGWAQVHGLRGDTSIDERTRYDIWYVENWSILLDVKILALTMIRFLFQKEAY
jgi:exopolysaccharide biosynthesis polyprenyl glycosylphosphotransferase